VAQEPRQTAANEWGTVTYYPEWKTLELKWGQKTRSMTDDGFKKTLKILADEGIKVRPSYMIVDMTIPLYTEAGVQKFAFLTTDRMPGTVEKGAEPVPDGPAKFPTGWFETRERMYAWLTA